MASACSFLELGAILMVPSPMIPFSSEIPCGLKPGQMIRILGKPSSNPERIVIALHAATNSDIALNIGLRFKWPDRFGNIRPNRIILNSRKNGAWGTEVIPESFPLDTTSSFEILIRADTDSFYITINGLPYQFEYRPTVPPLTDFKNLRITDDVVITQVELSKVPVAVPEP